MGQAAMDVHELDNAILTETAKKEVQDTSCRGSGGVPRIKKSPKIWGLGG
jgi:hypothetical protein